MKLSVRTKVSVWVKLSVCLQENIEVLHDERLVHRAMMSYFTDYSPQLGRYS